MTLGQDQEFSFDSALFPLPTSTGNTILVDADPVSQKILQFYRGILQLNAGARWAEECAACGMVNSSLQNLKDGYIVGDSVCYPVPSTLVQTDYKFPLLSVYRAREDYTMISSMKIATKSEFIVTWTMPPLNNPLQRNHLYPFLSAISKTLLFYTWQGNDPKYNNGELVWKEAGFAYALIEKAEIGSFLGQDGKTEFPSLKFHLQVLERNEFVPDNFEALTGFDGYISNVDGYNINDPYPDVSDFIIDSEFSINSFSPNSGPIAGNTLLVIQGTGFEAAKLTLQTQISVAGNYVQNFSVKSDSTIIAITGYATAGSLGPIVITDANGNITTSTQHFTYT